MVPLIISLAFVFTLISSIIRPTASDVPDGFIFGGCSPINFVYGSPYQTALNTILAAVTNSAPTYPYNHFSITSPDSPAAPLSALYQCRANVDNAACGSCIRRGASLLPTSLCPAATGAVLMLDDCYVRYNNVSGFVGAPDKTVMVNKCGPPPDDTDRFAMGHRDEALDQLGAGTELYREAEAEGVKGEAQCVGDLSAADCGDCVGSAIVTLRGHCIVSPLGEVYLGKCWVRLSSIGNQTHTVLPPVFHDSAGFQGGLFPTLAIIVIVIFCTAALSGLIYYLVRLVRKNHRSMAAFISKCYNKCTEDPNETTDKEKDIDKEEEISDKEEDISDKEEDIDKEKGISSTNFPVEMV